MRREIVKSENLAAPVGPYSVGTVYENLIFLSGCAAQDPETGLLIGETIEAQTQQTLKNLLTALKAAGGNKETE